MKKNTILITVFILFCLPINGIASSSLSFNQFIYQNDFEQEDPFQIWTTNGTYTVHYKGLTDENKSSGAKSFKFDVTLETAKYLYLMIPVNVAAGHGHLELSGDLKILQTPGVQVTMGASLSFRPSPLTGVLAIERMNEASQNWVHQSVEISQKGLDSAQKVVAKYAGGASATDVGVWVDKIAILIYSDRGGRISFLLDNVKLTGSVPDTHAYLSEVEPKWQEYLNKINIEVNQLVNDINTIGKNLKISSNKRYYDLAKKRALEIKGVVNGNRGFPAANDYEELKTYKNTLEKLVDQEAISGHESILTLYPWNPITNQKVLPLDYPLPVSAGNSIFVKACRTEIEPTSFIVHANKKLQSIYLSANDLIGPEGKKIPASSVDLKLVKCWYQSAEGTIVNRNDRVLTPELLLNDDDLVHVDLDNKKNYLRITQGNNTKYVDVSTSTASFPDSAKLNDATVLLPFNLNEGENKQIWVTIQIPENVADGLYSGDITIDVNGVPIGTMKLNVEVLPFDLADSVLEYAMYYKGYISSSVNGINANEKTESQYRKEMWDMKTHGVLYPTLMDSTHFYSAAFMIRNSVGMPKDHIYCLGNGTGKISTSEEIAAMKQRLGRLVNEFTSVLGCDNIYFYGVEELRGSSVLSQIPVWKAVHEVGGNVFTACYDDAVHYAGAVLDLAILAGAGPSKRDIVRNWHSKGKRVFNYGNPQAGIEEPDTYRKNYGINLFCNEYDGCMDYAYQDNFGFIWNDFDNQKYRDHVFAYPTSDGVIDTIEWEGFREGVDDIRYVSTLLTKSGKNLETIRQWVCGLIAAGASPADVRTQCIEQILRLNSTDLKAPKRLHLSD